MATLDQSDFKLMSRAFKEAFEDVLGGSTKGFGGRSARAPRERVEDHVPGSKQWNEASKNSLKSLKAFNAETARLAKAYQSIGADLKQYASAEKEYTDHLKKSSGYLESFMEATDQIERNYRKNLGAQRVATMRLAQSSDTLASKFTQAQRHSSLLTAAILSSKDNLEEGTMEYEFYVNKLSKSAEQLGQQFLEQEGLWDDLAKGVKDNLKPEDFKKLRVRLGEAGITLTKNFENFGDLGIKNIHDLAAKGGEAGEKHEANSSLVDAMKSTIKELVAQGHTVGGIGPGLEGAALDKAIVDLLAQQNGAKIAAKALSDFAKTTDKSAASIDAAATQAATKFGQVTYKLQAMASDPLLTLAKHVGSDATILKGMDMMKKGVTDLYKDLTDFNIANVPASFGEVSWQATKMGLSFKAGTEFLQANQHTLALYGFNAFDSLRGQLGATFTKFGYNLEQSSKLIGPAIAAATASGGVDIQNQNQLNTSILDSMNAFNKIKGVVGGTAEEYFKLNSSLFNQEGVSTTLLGLNKQQAGQYAKSLELSRNEIAARTGSLELAQRLTQEQESAKREDVESRINEGAQFAQLMAQVGYSAEDSARAQQTILAGAAATKEDSAWLAKMAPELKAKAAEYANQYTGTGNISGQINTELVMKAFSPSGAFGKFLNTNEEAARLAKSNSLLSPEQQAASSKAAEGSATGAKVGTLVNFIAALKDNPFVSTITGAGLALVGLATQSFLTTLSLRGLGGGMGSLSGVLSKFLGKGAGGAAVAAGEVAATGAGGLAAGEVAAGGLASAGLMGKMGGLGKGLTKGLTKGSIGGIVGGIALDYASTSLNESGHTTMGALADVGSDALSMASTGAMLGSIIPGVGNAVGAAVGGVLGAGYGLYKNREALFGSPAESGAPSPANAGQTVQPDGTVTQNNVNNQSEQSQATQSASGIQNVVDTQAIQQLLQIAENTSKSAQLLQLLVDGGGMKAGQVPASTTASRPTAYSYQTGRR